MKPLQLIFTTARSYRLPLAVAAVAMLALVGVQLLVPWVIKILLQTIRQPGGFEVSMGRIYVLTMIVLAVYIARAGLQFLRSYMSRRARRPTPMSSSCSCRKAMTR